MVLCLLVVFLLAKKVMVLGDVVNSSDFATGFFNCVYYTCTVVTLIL